MGKTGKSLERRLANHRGYVLFTITDRATGAHFNMPGHSLADLKITILEQGKKADMNYRKEREHYLKLIIKE